MDFYEAYQAGRRRLSIFGFYRRKRLLLSLEELRELVRPVSESFIGLRDIPVHRIIGSESRSADFAEGFYPVQKWMENRWTKVRQLLLGPGISEPIRVFEYGGAYFVRDGNHRVSVARTNGIEFLTAEVTVLKTPVSLCPGMNRARIPLFIAKLRFQQVTGVFDVIPEDHFFVNRIESWELIRQSIFIGHREWFIAKNGYEPDVETLVQSWVVELYETTMEFIKRHHLITLFHDMAETDVFCELMLLWQRMPGAWFPDVYKRYLRRSRLRNPLRLLHHSLHRVWAHYTATDHEERELFLQATRLTFFRPEARIPAGGKAWYRFLRHQMVVVYHAYLERRLGRNPYIHELAGSWYDELFAPTLALFDQSARRGSFPSFYTGMMRRFQRRILKAPHIPTAVAEAFRRMG